MQQDCDAAVTQVTNVLKSGGFSVLQSFDLQSAMKSSTGWGGNHDYSAHRMVVLLVYAPEGPPATLIFDSYQSQTLVHLGSGRAQPVHPSWIERLSQLLSVTFSMVNPIAPFVEQNNDRAR